MAWLRQWWTAVGLGLRAYGAHPRHLALLGSGFIVACTIVLVVLTIPAGVAQLATQTGRNDIAVVLSTTAMDEVTGSLSMTNIDQLDTLPGVAHTADGTALVAPQSVVQLKLQRRDGTRGTVLLRGITPIFWKVVEKRVQMVSGRRFHTGLNEIIAGDQASRHYLYLAPGQQFSHRFDTWNTTGVFSAGNSLWSNELWTDLAAVQGAYGSAGSASTVWVRLTSAHAFPAFKQALANDPQLKGFQVLRQSTFYARKVAFVSLFINAAALIIALILGLMATLTIHNAIALALAARRGELAVLRAMGFGQWPLLGALVCEALVIGAACSLLVIIATAWLLPSQSIQSSTGSEAIIFVLALTPKVMFLTLVYALVLAVFGTLIPAWRSLRAPLASTLAGD